MKSWKRLLAGFGALIVAGIAFVALFDDSVIGFKAVDVARVGNQEVVFSTECPWGHCTHKIGVRVANAPRISKWWQQSMLAGDGIPTLFVSRDGTLLAVATEEFGQTKSGDNKSIGHFFRAWHDFSSGRSATATATQTRPFSQQTRAMFAARGGKSVLELKERRLGMWRWQDRDYKNFQVQ